MTRHFRLLAALLLLSASACNCDDDSPPGSNEDASIIEDKDAEAPESGPGSTCLENGQACTSGTAGSTCCSGACQDGVCIETALCLAPGIACANNNECCTLQCVGGACGENLCRGIGQSCSAAGECCSGICGGAGTCEALPPGPGGESCITLGEACTGTTAGGGCCSTNCQGNVCVRAAQCQANGDVCFEHADCCGNQCSAAGGQPGRCEFVTGGGGGGCLQGGNPCPNGGSNCCSRVCVDIGAGVPVCQLAGGCRLTGEWCTGDDQCCGGGVNPNGSVVCEAAPLGRCDNGQACNGVGNICGAPVLPGGGSINASQNCCDGKKEVCKLDSSGIPRCFGGCPNNVCPTECPTGFDGNDPNCCIATGDECQFRDQCCNFAPCLPNANGVLVCGATPECQVVGATCTPGAPPGPDGCCDGTTCAESPVSGVFVCNPGTPDPGGGGRDGGVGDPDAGPACAANGAACLTGNECCSAICTGGMCGAPQQCQPANAACTSSGDCCAGLDCSIPSGSTTGTCQPGAECNNVGQACSAASPCCTTLLCRNVGTQVECDGTAACVCVVDL